VKKPEPATAQICQSKPLLSMSLQICLRLLVLDYGVANVSAQFSLDVLVHCVVMSLRPLDIRHNSRI
jgi:hypothetical protein